ncbi:MAG: hypothetical protein AAGA34_04480 [Pseudomonadota bacterium]
MNEALSVSRGLMEGTADALEDLSHEVEGLGAALCADPDIAARYLDQLQGVDRIAQSLEQLAHVLRAPQPDEAVDTVRLTHLQDQLRVARHA